MQSLWAWDLTAAFNNDFADNTPTLRQSAHQPRPPRTSGMGESAPIEHAKQLSFTPKPCISHDLHTLHPRKAFANSSSARPDSLRVVRHCRADKKGGARRARSDIPNRFGTTMQVLVELPCHRSYCPWSWASDPLEVSLELPVPKSLREQSHQVHDLTPSGQSARSYSLRGALPTPGPSLVHHLVLTLVSFQPPRNARSALTRNPQCRDSYVSSSHGP